jgi:tripartite-type tricarboxylate transporter receptor subunit TctC
MPDLISGRVQLNFGPVSSGLQHAREGKIRMLAILAPERSTLAPQVPTLVEAGVTSVSLPTWQAIFAPPKTPRQLTARLAEQIALVLRDAALRERLNQQGLQPQASTPEALSLLVERDVGAWHTFIRENDIPQE